MKMEIIIGMKIHRRNDTIDIAKGVGVALVIMGHTPSIVPEIIRNWISIFHMPLFFFLAGYFADYGMDKPSKSLKKSIKGLLLPYVIYSLIFSAVLYAESAFDKQILFSNLHDTIIGKGGGTQALYFFFVLFLIRLIHLSVSIVFSKGNDKKLIIATCIIVIAGFLIRTHDDSILFFIGFAMYFFGYYQIGRFYKYYKRDVFVATENKAKLLVTSVGLFVLAVIIYRITDAYDIFGACSCTARADILVCYFAAMLNIFGVAFLSRCLDKTVLGKIAAFVGRNTRYYYPLTNFIPIALRPYLEGGVFANIAKIFFSFAVPTILSYWRERQEK